MPRDAISSANPPRARSAARPDGNSAAERITSRDNRWLKLFRAALHEGYLEDRNLIGIEGPHLVAEAVRSAADFEAWLVSPAAEKNLPALLPKDAPSPPIVRTTDKLFATVAATEHPQGIAALVRARPWSFDDLVRGDIPLVVVLSGVQDPGNVGTAVRSAEAFAATGFVATRGTADPWSSKALRAAAGSALRLPLLRGIAPPILLTQLRVEGLAILAATSKPAPGTRTISLSSAAQLRSPCAIFVGNEGSGLAPEILNSADAQIAVPMAAGVESLNAGVAASIILYEAARRRSTEGSA